MATAVIMPRQGQSVESCIITSWGKKKGDKVVVGDILFSYETDKSSFDELSTVEGTLLEVFAEEGEDVPCLETVCIIGAPGEDISSLIPAKNGGTAPVESKTEAPKEEVPVAAAPAVSAAPAGELKISPRAKNLALKTNADLTKANPTGPNGRLIERDVNALLDRGLTVAPAALEAYLKDGTVPAAEPAVAPAPAAAAQTAPAVPAEPEVEYTDVKLSNIRKVIAKSMHASLSAMAQLTLNSSFDATQLLEYREKVKANSESLGLANITLNDMVLFAVAKTLINHKDLNAHFLDDKMRYFSGVHLGIAVDTEKGLLVPTLFDANRLTLNELSKKAKAIISDAQKGAINPDLLKGGTFTVTNLGSLGVESFTPVINPPQTGILGVNTITRRVKEVGGKDVFYPAMALSLTFDHRAIDGAPAARFLKELCASLENFSLLLSK